MTQKHPKMKPQNFIFGCPFHFWVQFKSYIYFFSKLYFPYFNIITKYSEILNFSLHLFQKPKNVPKNEKIGSFI